MPSATPPRMPDGGPLYTETHLDHFIKEPWNMATAGLFLVIAVYWALRLRGQYGQHPLLAWAVPLLLVGGVGGVIFHGFRLHVFFLVMDFLPILILLVAGAAYFWRQLLKSYWQVVLAVAPFALASGLVHPLLGPANRTLAINVGYVFLALTLLVPLALVLARTRWRHAGWLAGALVCFSVALTARATDRYSPAWLTVGTHFLWHVFGALASHWVVIFIYRYGKDRLAMAAPSPTSHYPVAMPAT